MNQTLEPPKPHRVSSVRARILVVEDDPVVRRLLRLHFHRAGLRTSSAGSGEDAIALCESDPEPIDLVLTDGVMPGMDGFDVARYFGRRSPDVPVILLSGFLHHFTSRPDIPENINAFFEKPFSPDELTAKVIELVEVAV